MNSFMDVQINNPKNQLPVAVTLLAFFFLLSCSSPPEQSPTPTPVRDTTPAVLETKTGTASFYGQAFQGQKTASGEIFDLNEMVAAHPEYPLGTVVLVTNLENNDTVRVRIIDRGPTKVNQQEGVIIDLSEGAAKKLKMRAEGRVRVKVDVLKWGEEDNKN